MSMLHTTFTRYVDVRKGEWGLAIRAFVTLFLTVAAHTMLETARDAIFLAKLAARDLNLVYVALAGLTLIATIVSTKLAFVVGRRNALICSLVGFAVSITALRFVPATPRIALVLYLLSGVEGAMLAPQFWLLAGDRFTVAQARRLFGSIASGGVAGGVVGAGAAALVVRAFHIRELLAISGGMFLVAGLVVATIERASTETKGEAPADASTEKKPRARPFKANPFLARIAALVSLSTAAVLVVDYLFKSSAARHVPVESLGYFFARYYAAMNAASLVVQVLIAGRLIRRVGVIGAVAVMPLLLLGGGVAALVFQGVFLFVLCVKTFDGALRYSLNRVATELLYLPVPLEPRQQAKGFIDSALSRIVQAVTAALLYFLALHSLATPRILAAIIVVLSAGWFALAVTLRSPYLDLFRRSLKRDGASEGEGAHELDMPSAEVLVESMGDPDPVTVVAAMNVLDEHHRMALIPSLVLYHDSPIVLVRALTLFGESTRTDWVPLAERLLGHPDDSVAAATVSALARAGRADALARAAEHPSPRVQAYLAFYEARRRADAPHEDSLLSGVTHAMGEQARMSRRALLDVVSDAPEEKDIPLLIGLSQLPELDADEEGVTHLARAVTVLRSPKLIDLCIQRIGRRSGRDAIRDALVAIGPPALDALEALLNDPSADRRLRLHAPRTISRFGNQRAADILVRRLLQETSGMIRYKVLRALGQLVARQNVKVDRRQIDPEAEKNLEEYMRLLSFRVALLAGTAPRAEEHDAPSAVLDGLIFDKMGQSMERAFRLLQIAHKRENIESVHNAARSEDKTLRANAGEFLDVLLFRHDQQRLRRLLRIVVDDARDVDRVRWAREEVPGLPETRVEVLTRLLDDKDEVLVALAARQALALHDDKLRGAVQRVRARSPSIEATSELLFGKSLESPEVALG